MAECILVKGGSGGVMSDDVTAARAHVLKGYRTITTDSGDEIAEGTIVSQAKIAATIKPGGSYTIPVGYYSQAGTVSCPVTVNSVVSFSVAAASYNTVTATWKWPSAGPYSGVIIRYKTGGYPTSVTDGTQGYKGTGSTYALNSTSTAQISGLTQDTLYYFRIWVYLTDSENKYYYSGTRDANTYTIARGMKTFASSQTWTVPARVTKIDIFCVGGGGGGGWYYSGASGKLQYYGAGGGGGYTTTRKGVSVSPGSSYAVTVGAGGGYERYGSYTDIGTDGGTSSFGTLCSAGGGWGGFPGSHSSMKTADGYREQEGYSSRGGSGGGGGAENIWGLNYSYFYDGGDGGSNGGNGVRPYDGTPPRYTGIGQGTTTRAFGESSGTLYSGGGGGSARLKSHHHGIGGAGGGGNGFNGGYYSNDTDAASQTPGATNTGGGGGGGGSYYSSREPRARGGSGIVIVRWGY